MTKMVIDLDKLKAVLGIIISDDAPETLQDMTEKTLRQEIQDLKDQNAKLLKALDAIHFYLDASPEELESHVGVEKIFMSADSTSTYRTEAILLIARMCRDLADPINKRETRFAWFGPEYPFN